MIYVFDVEGTLSQSKWREHLLPDYDAFHKKFHLDKPYLPMMKLLIDLEDNDSDVHILTGMMEKHRPELKNWLFNKSIYLHDVEIIMRANDDFRTSPDFKLETIIKIFPKEVKSGEILVFDDREDVIKALRGYGIPCVQVVQ